MTVTVATPGFDGVPRLQDGTPILFNPLMALMVLRDAEIISMQVAFIGKERKGIYLKTSDNRTMFIQDQLLAYLKPFLGSYEMKGSLLPINRRGRTFIERHGNGTEQTTNQGSSFRSS